MSDDDAEPPATMQAVRDLAAAASRLRAAVARRSGLSQSEMIALEHVVVGPSAPSEIARLLEVSTAASTGVVDRLERRGHVQRRPHPHDRRRTVVQVTDEGVAEMTEHLRPMLEALTRLDDDLTPERREVVTRFLQGATAAFETVSGDAARPLRPALAAAPRPGTAQEAVGTGSSAGPNGPQSSPNALRT